MALTALTDVFAYINLSDETIRVDGTDIVDCGDWNASVAYQPNNVVAFQNGLFISLTANFNRPPTGIVNDNWSSLVKTTAGTDIITLQETYDIAVSGSILAYETWGSLQGGGFIPNANDVIFCHHVNWGTQADQVNAAQMPYQGEYPTVGAALDALLYVPLKITSFGNTVNTVEIGQTVTTVGLSWVYNKAELTQVLSQGIGAIPLNQFSYTDTGVWTSNRSYQLTAGDGQTIATATTTIGFSPKRYWGVSTDPAITDAEIIALSSEFASGFAQSRTITASAQYIYFAFPASFGTPTFTVNGLLNTAWTPVTRTFVNASGYASSYAIWQSNNLLTGVYQIVLS
jgi:hypothetical protein